MVFLQEKELPNDTSSKKCVCQFRLQLCTQYNYCIYLNAIWSFYLQEKVTEFGILKENMFAFWDVSNSGNTKTD